MTAARILALALLVRWLCSFPGVALAQQEIVTLSTRPGVTQSYFLTSVPKNLLAVAVLFPGSGGLIQLRTENGQAKFGQGNFLVRSRAEFVKRGVAAAIIDAPSDQQAGWGMSDEFRLGDLHHVSDQCEVTPYSDAARLSDKYPLITVYGGAPPQSGPCDAFSAHGYLGKEAETVEQIVNWMLKKPFLHEVK